MKNYIINNSLKGLHNSQLESNFMFNHSRKQEIKPGKWVTFWNDMNNIWNRCYIDFDLGVSDKCDQQFLKTNIENLTGLIWSIWRKEGSNRFYLVAELDEFVPKGELHSYSWAVTRHIHSLLPQIDPKKIEGMNNGSIKLLGFDEKATKCTKNIIPLTNSEFCPYRGPFETTFELIPLYTRNKWGNRKKLEKNTTNKQKNVHTDRAIECDRGELLGFNEKDFLDSLKERGIKNPKVYTAKTEMRRTCLGDELRWRENFCKGTTKTICGKQYLDKKLYDGVDKIIFADNIIEAFDNGRDLCGFNPNDIRNVVWGKLVYYIKNECMTEEEAFNWYWAFNEKCLEYELIRDRSHCWSDARWKFRNLHKEYDTNTHIDEECETPEQLVKFYRENNIKKAQKKVISLKSKWGEKRREECVNWLGLNTISWMDEKNKKYKTKRAFIINTSFNKYLKFLESQCPTPHRKKWLRNNIELVKDAYSKVFVLIKEAKSSNNSMYKHASSYYSSFFRKNMSSPILISHFFNNLPHPEQISQSFIEERWIDPPPIDYTKSKFYPSIAERVS